MDKDIRNGFIVWAGFAFFGLFGFALIIFSNFDISKMSEYGPIALIGALVMMMVIKLTMALDGRVRNPDRRVYR